MTRSSQRFTLAVAVLTLNAGLIAALVYMALMGKQVGGDQVLYMAVGAVTAWGGTTLQFYFGTSESSVQKSEIMDRMTQGEE